MQAAAFPQQSQFFSVRRLLWPAFHRLQRHRLAQQALRIHMCGCAASHVQFSNPFAPSSTTSSENEATCSFAPRPDFLWRPPSSAVHRRPRRPRRLLCEALQASRAGQAKLARLARRPCASAAELHSTNPHSQRPVYCRGFGDEGVVASRSSSSCTQKTHHQVTSSAPWVATPAVQVSGETLLSLYKKEACTGRVFDNISKCLHH